MHTCNTVKLFSWTEMPPRLFVIDLICWWCSSLISLSFFSFSRRIWIESHKTHTLTHKSPCPATIFCPLYFESKLFWALSFFELTCFYFWEFFIWRWWWFGREIAPPQKKKKQKNFLVRSPLPNLPWSLVYTSKGIFTTPKTKTKTKKFFFRRIQRRKEQQRNKMIITITARLKKTRNDDDINYVSLRLEIVFSILS